MELKRELVKLCRALNESGVRYVVIGGCAVILHGYYRTTHDIDLLIDVSVENIRFLRDVLSTLYPEQPAFDLDEGDFRNYVVIRFAPEGEDVVIDLMAGVGDVTAHAALDDLEEVVRDGRWVQLGLNMTELSRHVRMIRQSREAGTTPVAHWIGCFLWRLVILKRYVEANNLNVL